jgi:glycosyltransferase involved in cell wall biosynthesis
VAVCESIKRGLVASGVRADKIEVIYSGTDTDRFSPAVDGSAIRRELGLGPNNFLFTQIGVRSWKGNDDTIDALALVVARRPQARLLIVGARDPSGLRERAAVRAVGERVLFLGYRDDIPEILAASDCCIDASYAGLGITGTLREALAVQTPVIASDLEGNPELVIDGHTGLLFPPRNVPALAGAMIRMLDDCLFAEATALAGRKLVEASFSSLAKLNATEALYRRLYEAR